MLTIAQLGLGTKQAAATRQARIHGSDALVQFESGIRWVCRTSSIDSNHMMYIQTCT